MDDNIAARPATSPELTNLRGANGSKVYMVIQTPITVYSARINQTFDSLIDVVQLTYDGGTGTLSDVLPGMTIFIGSSSGAHDKGMVRVRKLPTSDTFYIPPTSGISFADNDCLTVVNLMPIYPRHLNTDGGSTRMDYDIEFGASPVHLPMVVLGPLMAVIHLELDEFGDYIPQDFTPPLPTRSWSPDGEDIASYLYACPGAASTSDLDTTTPIFTIDTPGQYLWYCTVTDALGRTNTGYRWLLVDPDPVDFSFEEISGDSYTVEMDDMPLSSIVERAMVIVYSKDYFGDPLQETYIGPIEDYENILDVGWIEDESIAPGSESGTVRFNVRSAAFWLNRISGYPIALKDVSAAPTNWNEINSLTIRKAVAFLMTWTTTAGMLMDCIAEGEGKRAPIFTFSNGGLLDQLSMLANKIFAKPLINQLGQLFIEVDAQFLPTADRDNVPVIQEITGADILDGSLSIERRTGEQIGLVEMGGYQSYDGSTIVELFSRAPGNYPTALGAFPESPSDYIFDDQDDCNRLAGCYHAVTNNEYYEISFAIPENNKLISTAPRQYLTFSIDVANNPRGISLTDYRIIPRRISRKTDPESGETILNLTCEGEAIGMNGVAYYPPQPTQDNLMDAAVPDFGFVDYPGGTIDFPMDIPIADMPSLFKTGCIGNYYAKGNSFSLSWDKTDIRGEDADRVAHAYFPCSIRATAFTPTSINIGILFKGDAASHWHVYGVSGGARVITATISGHYANFSPITDLSVDGFEIELDAGMGSGLTFSAGDIISSDSVDALLPGGVAIPVTSGKWYAVDGAGGPWLYQAGAFPSTYFYNFNISPDGINWSGGTDSGGIGYTPTKPPSGGMSLEYGVGAAFAEQISTLYGRGYIYASQDHIWFRVSDWLFGDNGGNLGYVLRNADVTGRRILLSNSTLLNVCAQP